MNQDGAGPHPLILTALLDPASQARFDGDRQRHFPAAINYIDAHVTLFHHLPGLEQAAIEGSLGAICRRHAPVPFTTTGLRFLGRGTAYALDMPAVAVLRRDLAGQWQHWLTAQDRQGWQPHVTVQNKVAPADARRLFQDLQAGFAPWGGLVGGLSLWRYRGGPWELVGHHPFSDGIA